MELIHQPCPCSARWRLQPADICVIQPLPFNHFCNGTIAVSGGGAAAINVAASGAGLILPFADHWCGQRYHHQLGHLCGTITSIGCSAITAYGIEWSTTAGFPNGTRTAVPSLQPGRRRFSVQTLPDYLPPPPIIITHTLPMPGNRVWITTVIHNGDPRIVGHCIDGLRQCLHQYNRGPERLYDHRNQSYRDECNSLAHWLDSLIRPVPGGPYTATLSLAQPRRRIRDLCAFNPTGSIV